MVLRTGTYFRRGRAESSLAPSLMPLPPKGSNLPQELVRGHPYMLPKLFGSHWGLSICTGDGFGRPESQ